MGCYRPGQPTFCGWGGHRETAPTCGSTDPPAGLASPVYAVQHVGRMTMASSSRGEHERDRIPYIGRPFIDGPAAAAWARPAMRRAPRPALAYDQVRTFLSPWAAERCAHRW